MEQLRSVADALMRQCDDGYPAFEEFIRRQAAAVVPPLFSTDTQNLFETYLAHLPAHRQHYNCSACRRFLERYGSLAMIEPDEGQHLPALWAIDPWEENPPEFFGPAVRAMYERVMAARVTGVFLDEKPIWGTPNAGGWSHLAAANPCRFVAHLQTPEQKMAELAQDREVLCHALAKYPLWVVQQAIAIIAADGIDHPEKAADRIQWFRALQVRIEYLASHYTSPRHTENAVWHAAATAPPGFAKIPGSIVGSLLDDIKGGLSLPAVQRRWSAKLNPLQYQRPQAPPKEGAIDAAERLFEKTGAVKALERRHATIDDIQSYLWRPRILQGATTQGNGVFAHLRGQSKPVRHPKTLPAQPITWHRFSDLVLPAAEVIDLYVPAVGNFYGLTTAACDAPPILQWDGLPGHIRNPVSWYVYPDGAPAARWGLLAGSWAEVACVFLGPYTWQEPGMFPHQGERAFFALGGCKDTNGERCGLCLFPAHIRSEYHEVRSVIEAHSKAGKLSGLDRADAAGIMLQGMRHGATPPIRVRVRSWGVIAEYTIDRWD